MMKEPSTISYESATYRLVGVITIGKTRIPIVGFGYPKELKFSDRFRNRMEEMISEHRYAMVEIERLEESLDRVTWCIFKGDPTEKQIDEKCDIPFYLYLDLPMGNREKRIGTTLFSSASEEEKGYLVAITAEDSTHLCFYNVKMVRRNPETNAITGLIGEMDKYITGDAVPLLRTIETLQSQKAPQRRIEISDEELGIIYESLT